MFSTVLLTLVSQRVFKSSLYVSTVINTSILFNFYLFFFVDTGFQEIAQPIFKCDLFIHYFQPILL